MCGRQTDNGKCATLCNMFFTGKICTFQGLQKVRYAVVIELSVTDTDDNRCMLLAKETQMHKGNIQAQML